MIGSTNRQASLFFFAFAKEVSAIKDVTLDELDELLQDGLLLELTSEKLGGRRLRSKDFGRPGLAPDRLLRCVVLKHLKSWSFRELEYELRHSLLYRRFTRFFEDPIPDFTSFSRTFALFGPAHAPNPPAGGPKSQRPEAGARSETADRHHGRGDQYSLSPGQLAVSRLPARHDPLSETNHDWLCGPIHQSRRSRASGKIPPPGN